MYDRFNRCIHYLRLSVTDRCNLRCTYCMPAEGVQPLRHDDILSFEEMAQLTQVAVELGINKVRLTGGEPLVRRGIVDLVAMLARIDGIDDLAMTTNGTYLSRYGMPLKQAGLQRLNISLDTLDPHRFSQITRGGRLDDVLDGIEAARQAGFDCIKLNCVIQASPQEPDALAVAAYGAELGLEVRFIRRMDMQRGRFWRVLGGDGGHCEACNRLRVSSDGKIYPCLFSNQSYDVRQLGMETALRGAIANKPRSGHKSDHSFYRLGG